MGAEGENKRSPDADRAQTPLLRFVQPVHCLQQSPQPEAILLYPDYLLLIFALPELCEAGKSQSRQLNCTRSPLMRHIVRSASAFEIGHFPQPSSRDSCERLPAIGDSPCLATS